MNMTHDQQRDDALLQAARPGDTALLLDDDRYGSDYNAFPDRRAFELMCEELEFDPEGANLHTIIKQPNGLWRSETDGTLYDVLDGATVYWARDSNGRLNVHWPRLEQFDLEGE